MHGFLSSLSERDPLIFANMIRVTRLILSRHNATLIQMVLLASLIRTSQCHSHSCSFGFSHSAGFLSGLSERDSLVFSNMIRVARLFISLSKPLMHMLSFTVICFTSY